MVIPVLLFLLMTGGIGAFASFLRWDKEGLIERFCMSIGMGLVSIPVIATVCNVTGLPIRYELFLGLGILGAGSHLFSLIRHLRRTPPPAGPWWRHLARVRFTAPLVLFAVTLAMYLIGSFNYPFFEDGDPWLYAAVAKYISLFHTYTTSFHEWVFYPYPQGFPVILSLCSQFTRTIYWPVKFFNSLILALSVPFFYYTVRKLVPGRGAATFGTLCLFSIPAWLSHFIFPLGTNMVFFVVLVYSILKSETNSRWFIGVAIAYSAVWLIHFYSAAIITLLLIIYFLLTAFCRERFDRRFLLALTAGGGFVLLFFILPAQNTFMAKLPGGMGRFIPLAHRLLSSPPGMLLAGGFLIGILAVILTDHWWIPRVKTYRARFLSTSSKPFLFCIFLVLCGIILTLPLQLSPRLDYREQFYTLNHFFVWQPGGVLIQTPSGIGASNMILVCIALALCWYRIRSLFTPANTHRALIFSWAIFAFVAVNSEHFSVHFMPVRMWPFCAFASALLAAYAYDSLIGRGEAWTALVRLVPLIRRLPVLLQDHTRRAVLTALAVLCVVGSLFTWYFNKLPLNIMPWNTQYIIKPECNAMYWWVFINMPKNSRVYAMGIDQFIPIGYDMISYPWDREVFAYCKQDIQDSPENNYAFLKQKGYEYLIVDVSGPLYQYRVVYDGIPVEQRQVLIYQLVRIFNAKREALLRMPDKFVPVKTFGDTGIIFKII